MSAGRPWTRGGTKLTTGQDRGRLSPCVCNTLRMVTRVVTQLYDDCLRPSGLRVTQFSILAAIARLGESSLKQLEASLAIDQTTLTRSLGLLERDGVIERASHPDGRIKAMRLTAKGRRALDVARPLWMRVQDKVLRELGTKAWARAQRRLAHLLHVAVEKRRLGRSLRSSRRRDGSNHRAMKSRTRILQVQSRAVGATTAFGTTNPAISRP